MLGNLNITPVTKTCYFSDGLLLQCASIIGSQNCRVWGFFLQQCFLTKLGHCFSFFSPLRVFQFCLFSILNFFNSIFPDPTSSWFCSIPLFCVFRSWGVWGRRMRTVADSQCPFGHSGWDSSSCVGWKIGEELGDHGCSSYSFLWVSWWRMYWLGSGSLNC